MKKIPTWFKTLLLFVFIYLFAFQPIPYYMERPGNAFGLNEMIKVDGEISDASGEFYITTVGIQQVTPMTALASVLPYHDLLNEQEMFGGISDFKTYDVIQQYYMESSSNTAIQVAFEAANLPYNLVYNGVYVLQVLNESNFSNSLQVGDTVKAVDGQQFNNSHDFIEYVSRLKVGQTIDISYERSGEVRQTSGGIIPLETGKPGIGIGLVDNTSLETEPTVEINSGQIGGPSAGLMFSLQIYNLITNEDILGSQKIAGTGTITPDALVGRIGGIDKKIVAADKAGAKYFFAPDDEIPEEVKVQYPEIKSNYDEAVKTAKDINTDMKVIPVKTFMDAIHFLKTLEKSSDFVIKMSPLYDLGIEKEYPNRMVALDK